MKVYADTNILIDLLCSRDEFLSDAQLLFGMGYDGKIRLVLSALSFVNTVYIGRKYRFSTQEMKESLLRIASFVEVSDLSGDAVLWALSCDWSDYEDATQYRSALSSGADCIVTRNKKDYSKSSLPVYSVSELIERLDADEKGGAPVSFRH